MFYTELQVFSRLQFHVQRGGTDGVEVWLEGERGVAHQLLTTNYTLRENLSNKTLTEFPLLHVVSKGAGPPSVTTASLQSKSPSAVQASVSKCGGKETSPTAGDTISEEDALARPPDRTASGPPDHSRGGKEEVLPRPLDHRYDVTGDVVPAQENALPGPRPSEWYEKELNLKSGVTGISASLKLIASMYSDSEDDM